MASNKFVIKCGNFAVLVDVHILPQGSSKDTSWFSDHEKENVCMLLEEVVASRVKQYLEAPKQRGQWKSMEHAPSGPLFLTDLRVFPDRFIVCVTKLDFDPSDWTCDNDVLKEELSNRTSEYFTESAENKKVEISLNEQIKQGILKEIVKRTKLKKSNTSKPQISKDSKKVSLGSVDSQTGNRENDLQTSLSPQSEVTCRRSPGLLKDCTNTIESNLELPVLELENNQRQPDGVSSQQKPRSVEWLKSSLLSENSPCSSESALLGPKRSQKVTKTQAQQKTCAPEEKVEHFENLSSEGTLLIPSNTEMSKCDDGCLGPFLEEETPLNSGLFSKQDMTKATSDEESLKKNLSQPLSVRNSIAQTSQNEPSTTPEDVMPPSCIELQPVPSEKLSQKRKKEVENGLRKLKLRRLKRSKV
ncbi:protein SLX4IP isoform X2 [Melopsittacus undulatus]|uniref:protein SLX4IP isoform X2 n=1 Tax=Melopsittacus undulatus TaxID=13146 RepID=UPI00146A1FF8|nr:protein SLX4IP isoform X2 [Melopsittacus undulatus]